MTLLLFAVRDAKAELYTGLMTYNAKGAALRAFTDACNDKNHAFGQHPADYTMFFLGTYNDETGLITPSPEGPIVLNNGATLVTDPIQGDPRQLKAL